MKIPALLFLFFAIFFQASQSRADPALKLIIGTGISADYDKFLADSYPTTQIGGSIRTNVFVPLNAYTDAGLRTQFFSNFADAAGVGGVFDGVFRWFPLTYSRVPDFSAGPTGIKFNYGLMPYVGVGFGMNFQVVQQTPFRRVLGILPKIPIVVGSYFPMSNSRLAFESYLEAGFGRTIKKGGVEIQEVTMALYIGIALF